VHLTAREHGFIISSAILAQTIAVATGSALAFKMDNSSNVAVTFFGDAACEEGASFESLNYSSTNKLPVLYVCENNLYSTESPLETRQPQGTDLCERANAFKIKSKKIDGNNALEVVEATKEALEHIRSGNGPFFLECMTYRWREHVGPNFDFDVSGRNYRSEEEQKDWMQHKCPVKFMEQYLIGKDLITTEEINTIRTQMQEEIDNDVMRARNADWPRVEELYANTY